MKTSAFLIRVAICFLLSLIPVTELENRVYSERLDFRGHWEITPHIIIVELDPASSDADLYARTRRIRDEALASGALLVQVLDPTRAHEPMTDNDGVVRRAALLGKSGPSLAYQAFLTLHGPNPTGPSARNAVHPERPHLINFLGEPGSVPRCEAYQCLKNPTAAFKDRVVLISQETEPTMFRTPVGDMTRAEVIANDIDTIVARKPIYQASLLSVACMIMAMILLGAFYIMYYPVMISAIAVAGTGLVVVIAAFQGVFQLFDVYIPSMNIGGSLLITYLIFTGYRLAFQENLQWRAHKQAQYLRELDQLKTNFLSLVSHDLKTPIAKIQAVTERLRRESKALEPEKRAEWHDLLESIENSNNELKHTITSILNLSKIEAQKVILNKKSNDINSMISAALKRLRPLAQQKNIVIEEQLEPLFSVECDEDLFRQVVSNLVDNAIKYSPAGSKVIVRSREEDSFVRVEVQDFGPGIPKDELPKMFRKFSRLRSKTGDQVKGTGLGLYLSKYFIELHGGKIQVRSLEGEHTTFGFTLPLQESPAPEAHA